MGQNIGQIKKIKKTIKPPNPKCRPYWLCGEHLQELYIVYLTRFRTIKISLTVFLIRLHDTLFSLVRQNKNLPDVPLASPPALTTARGGGVRVILYIEKVQKYLIRLTYNHTGPSLTKCWETAHGCCCWEQFSLRRKHSMVYNLSITLGKKCTMQGHLPGQQSLYTRIYTSLPLKENYGCLL
jgi:hypothetical protein